MPIDFSSFDPGAPVPATPTAVDVPDAREPLYAWVLPVAGLAGLVGLFLPWFHGYATDPHGTVTRFHGIVSSWDDGRIGLLPGLLLAGMGVAAAVLLRPKNRRRADGDPEPAFKAARQAVIAGVVSLACLLVAVWLVPHEYRFGGESWNAALAVQRERIGPGVQFHRGPQPGLWVTLTAASIALVVGLVLMYRLRPSRYASPRAGADRVSADGWALPADSDPADG